jgi:hypothetical protein
MSSIDTVRKIYEAFGKGDVPAILETISEDCEWEYGLGKNPVPWLQPRRGKKGAGEFFASLAAMEISHFAVKEIVGDGKLVVALVDIDFTVKATGKKVSERDEVHVWRFDDRGRVARFRHACDTHTQSNAVAP